MKRLNKEYKLDVCQDVSAKYGSINKDDPQVVYVSCRCWVRPQHEMNYAEAVSNVEEEIRKNIKEFFTNSASFENKFILDFDINTDRMTPLAKKFLSFDFYVKQNEQMKKSLKELKELMTSKVSTIVNRFTELMSENDFAVTKKK